LAKEKPAAKKDSIKKMAVHPMATALRGTIHKLSCFLVLIPMEQS
jgi:hypothetical protein